MEDLAGFGKATEKFLDIVRASVGTLYRPKSIRAEEKARADANAYGIIATARAEAEAKLIAFDGEKALEERTIERLKHQELQKQKNIESIIEQTLPEIKDRKLVDEPDKDWLALFFERSSGISDKKIQELWSKVLAAKMLNESGPPRKVIDCLRWLDEPLASKFAKLAVRIDLFGGFFTDELVFNRRELRSISTPYNEKSLEEIGLISENISKSFDFRCFSLRIQCREMSDRSLRFRRFYEFTPSGRALSRIVVPEIAAYLRFIAEKEPDYLKRFSLFHSDKYGALRDKAEALLLPRAKKMRICAEHIVHFLMGGATSVRIEKVIYMKRGQHSFHTPGTVLDLSKDVKKRSVRIKRNHGAHWDAMGPHECKFIDEVIAHIQANEDVIING